ncbi:prephenate dehydrogenase [uncultured Methanobrevibacter sp.]|uniref:prephenate dehydrogenase n=1 Tax=uncultured Methanobrevibacter sp. TaxID=253161 RepID=UPI0025F26A99|nr:prephenate dehydrogenase [uncultured Methanobrevibacter sp.]
MKVGIIGGSDGLGKTLIYYFRDEFDVIITARNHEKGRNVANKANVKYIESNTELASISDILVISVPINHTSDVIREVAGFMKEGSLMVDVTSIKEEPLKTMSETVPENVEYIPTHPIFGPRTTELDNQVIVLTPDKKGKWFDKVYNYLSSKNMRVIITSAEKHDFMMSIVQILTHFSFISTTSAIEKLKVDIKETENYESPIYNLMIDVIARISAQNPYLTYNIQTMNENGPKIRNTFVEAVSELRDVINNGDDEKFVSIVEKSVDHMGDVSDALGRSDKAIRALSHEYTLLNQSIGHEVGLKNFYTGEINVGILENITPRTASLNCNGNIKEIIISHIDVLDENELQKWKNKTLNKTVENIRCILPENIDTEIIKKTVMKTTEIAEIEVIEDVKINNSTDITFKVTAVSQNDIDKVKKLLKGFGAIIE